MRARWIKMDDDPTSVIGENPSKNWSYKRFKMEMDRCREILRTPELNEHSRKTSIHKRKALNHLLRINKYLEGMLK